MTVRGRIILGIDPGTAATGYGVIEQRGNRLEMIHHGVVETSAGEEPHHRLAHIYDEIAEVLAHHQPDAAAVESLFFNVNVRTALAVGQSRGVALLACSRSGCALFEYTPQQVKQAVVGYGKAEKRQVQEMVRVLLGLKDIPRPDHAADALAVAVCHAHSHGVQLRAEAALARVRGDRRKAKQR
ncbi:MAG: crossover junction endodeoxyribonuclease RuvC [Thermoleophilia bacterium]|nr:crossover junction endodeoxyribonuclease RuvC [Thermoleophilia bacterium]